MKVLKLVVVFVICYTVYLAGSAAMNAIDAQKERAAKIHQILEDANK